MGRFVIVLCCLLLLAGCGGGNGVTSSNLAGRWTTVNQFPGSGTTLDLATRASTVSGTGTYRIEAGRSGTLQVTGTVNGAQFTLTLVYDYGVTSIYQGSVVDANSITGSMRQAGGQEYTVSMVRQ